MDVGIAVSVGILVLLLGAGLFFRVRTDLAIARAVKRQREKAAGGEYRHAPDKRETLQAVQQRTQRELGRAKPLPPSVLKRIKRKLRDG